jgi:hypothetical protein
MLWKMLRVHLGDILCNSWPDIPTKVRLGPLQRFSAIARILPQATLRNPL